MILLVLKSGFETRVCGQSGEPDESGSDGNEGLKPDIEFVVARSDTAKPLQACKESFNEISTFIDMLVIASEHLSIGFRWNDRCGIHCLDALNEVGGVKSFVGHDGTNDLQAIDEIGRFGDVVSFATGRTEVRQIAQPINRRMNFGAQSPTRTAKTLLPVFLGAPAACWCARTMVLSRNTSSKSASSQSLAKSACQTPLSAQREKRLNEVFHGPKSDGRSRQGAPVLAIQRTASTNKRLSAPLRPRSPDFPCSIGSIRSHCSSRNSNLGIPSSIQKTGCKHNQSFVNSALITNVHAL